MRPPPVSDYFSKMPKYPCGLASHKRPFRLDISGGRLREVRLYYVLADKEICNGKISVAGIIRLWASGRSTIQLL